MTVDALELGASVSEFNPADHRSPSDPSRAARQCHTVLAWLVVEADVPDLAHLHLVDALVAWAPLMGEHLFPTEPRPASTPPSGRRLAVVAARRPGCQGSVGGQGCTQ
jgi:hypothetical protein